MNLEQIKAVGTAYAETRKGKETAETHIERERLCALIGAKYHYGVGGAFITMDDVPADARAAFDIGTGFAS